MEIRHCAVALLTALLLALGCGSALGSGFAIIEQSVSSFGTSNAGGAAVAEDATTVFFNPAGMTRLPGRQLAAGLFVIHPTATFKDNGSTHVLGGALNGGNGGEAGDTALVPNLYYVHRLSDRLAVGLGVNVPFGLSSDYDKGWVGRYHAIRSVLMTVNINPSIALRINDRLSVGAGFSVQRLEAELTNAIDLGTLDALPLALGGLGGLLGLVPQGADGHLKVEGDSWGHGYNLGLMFEFSEGTRAGASYRSEITHRINGRADFSDVPAAIVAATGGFFSDTGARASITMPDSASISLFHGISPKWHVMADISWTGWSSLRELRVKFDSGQPDGVTTLQWKDSMRYAFGFHYLPSQRLTLRGGISYDETPIPDARRLTPRLPGATRVSLASGLGYKFTENLTLNVAYAHFFIRDPSINKAAIGENALLGGLQGVYDAAADILSMQLNWSF